MKIRQGFVSNSSSSSFIVPFPKNLKVNTDNVHEFLFGSKTPTNVVNQYNEHTIPSYDAVKTIISAMRRQKFSFKNRQRVLEEAINGYIQGEPEWEDLCDANTLMLDDIDELDKLFKQFNEAISAYRTNALNSCLKQWGPDVDVYVFDFDDNDEWGATMEHGDVFSRVPHLKVSK